MRILVFVLLGMGISIATRKLFDMNKKIMIQNQEKKFDGILNLIVDFIYKPTIEKITQNLQNEDFPEELKKDILSYDPKESLISFKETIKDLIFNKVYREGFRTIMDYKELKKYMKKIYNYSDGTMIIRELERFYIHIGVYADYIFNLKPTDNDPVEESMYLKYILTADRTKFIRGLVGEDCLASHKYGVYKADKIAGVVVYTKDRISNMENIYSYMVYRENISLFYQFVHTDDLLFFNNLEELAEYKEIFLPVIKEECGNYFANILENKDFYPILHVIDYPIDFGNATAKVVMYLDANEGNIKYLRSIKEKDEEEYHTIKDDDITHYGLNSLEYFMYAATPAYMLMYDLYIIDKVKMEDKEDDGD